MNAHTRPEQRAVIDDLEIPICDLERKAQATSIIAQRLLGELKKWASSEQHHHWPVKVFVDVGQREIQLLLDYLDDLDNEARRIREKLYEVM